MPKFRTAYSGQEAHHTASGRPVKNEYQYEIEDGHKKLVKVGETNIYEKIQEAYPATKIENILKKASIGDMSGFIGEGQYIDTTELPKNMIEARKSIMKLENTWNNLPKEIKEKFNYDLEEFINNSGSKEWYENLGMIKTTETTQEPTQKPTQEPKTEKTPETSN